MLPLRLYSEHPLPLPRLVGGPIRVVDLAAVVRAVFPEQREGAGQGRLQVAQGRQQLRPLLMKNP